MSHADVEVIVTQGLGDQSGNLGIGIADQDAREKQLIFQQRYRGSRYSFGYPACPRLEDQVKIWPLLDPERIGVQLSEEFQVDPEQSTNALIAHHPEAKYFNVR